MVPIIITNLYNQKDDAYVYESQINYDPKLETGYPNVVYNVGQKKYKSQITYLIKNRKKTKNFYHNNAKKCEKERKNWMNKNVKLWSDYVRPTETVFDTKLTKKRYNAETLIENNDILNWSNIVSGDIVKTWNIVKKKIKERTKNLQIKIWNEAEEGKVLKKYKKGWWDDIIMNQVSNPYVLVIKRLRIGNSTLSHHRKQGGAGVCSNCHLGEPETNKHYFLKCPKFSVHRKKLYHSIGENINNMKVQINDSILLGYYPNIFKSKKKLKYYKNDITNIYSCVCDYIKDTHRFDK